MTGLPSATIPGQHTVRRCAPSGNEAAPATGPRWRLPSRAILFSGDQPRRLPLVDAVRNPDPLVAGWVWIACGRLRPCGQRQRRALPTLAHSLSTPTPNTDRVSLTMPSGPDALRLPQPISQRSTQTPRPRAFRHRNTLFSGAPIRDQTGGGLRFNARPNRR